MNLLSCPVCGTNDPEIFYEQEEVPVDSCRQFNTREEAFTFPTGSIKLGFCNSCGFIWNTSFNHSLKDFSSGYEETQVFSPRYQKFQKELANRLIRKFGLYDKAILEIGCGKSDFLNTICRLGNNQGVGIDPNLDENRVTKDAQITFIKDRFSENYSYLIGDFIICRHTLEHIYSVRDFLIELRNSIGHRTSTIVFFEVPDMMRILVKGAFWDIYYEHCSYFTSLSLTQLFETTGFEILDVGLDFEDQYILLEGRPLESKQGKKNDVHNLVKESERAVRAFRLNYEDKLKHWRKVFEFASDGNHRVVLWGSGCKSNTFLNSIHMEDKVDYIVNINPCQQGKYVVKTGQQIVAPSFLQEYKPNLVISLNNVYLEEIRNELKRLGVDAELIAI